MTENWTPDSAPSDAADEHSNAGQPLAAESGADLVFEDLSLGQALGYLFWRPAETARLFWRVLTYEPSGEVEPAQPVPLGGEDRGGWDEESFPVRDEATSEIAGFQTSADDDEQAAVVESAAAPLAWAAQASVVSPARERRLAIGIVAVSVLLAMRGGVVLHRAALDPQFKTTQNTDGAFLWLAAAGALYVGYAIFRARDWWAERFPEIAGRLRNHIQGSRRSALWNGGLALSILIALWLAVVGAGNGWIALALLALAGALCIALALANTFPPEVSVQAAAPDEAASDASDKSDALVIRSQAAAPRAANRYSVWLADHLARLVLVPPALLLSAVAYSANVQRDSLGQATDVVFTTGGFIGWIASILLWIVILAVDVRSLPERWNAFDGPAAARRLAGWLRPTWTGAALIAVMVLGAAFRLYDLDSTPPEMTSDHIEKLLDALRVSEGYYGVFFPNNGGREGFQMYVVAAIADWFGVGFGFRALKLATVVEGVITLPALWWMARQVLGNAASEDRRLGNWVGLILAGLVAISSWHVMLSRLGLRIVLTPLTTALAIGFLARAMRGNRMRDYVALGGVLGAGVYFYQANRMLPVVVLIGVGLALLRGIRSPGDLARRVGEVFGFAALAASPLLVYWYIGQVFEQSGYTNLHDLGERLGSLTPLFAMVWLAILALAVRVRRSDHVLQVGGGLLATIVVALAVFIPMYRYSEINPHDFWNRTRGRLFGEDAFVRYDPGVGATVPYDPLLSEQIERFWEQRDVFAQNLEDALRMFHWEGDGAWINNAHAYPALSALPGGLMILGLMMWGVRMVRSRDAVAWLLPAAGAIMLLPSALTLAYTIENPSFTRASGAIPIVYLLAALPLGVLCWRLSQIPRRIAGAIPVGAGIAVVLVAGVLWQDLRPNWDNYFTSYRLSYSYSWKPYREIARPLREFAQGEGSYGNAFMVAYPHWLDHRILGTMAGDIRWPNGLVTREDLFGQIRANAGTRYAYNSDKPLFVMYNAQDSETAAYLQAVLPGGTTELYEYTYEAEGGERAGSFYIYRVQAGALEGMAG